MDPADVFVSHTIRFMPRKAQGLDDESRLGQDAASLVAAMSDAMAHSEMPDLKAIICAFTRKCGGADGIARMLRREYHAAKPGTMIRSMILQMILQGSKAISAKLQSRDESMISDDDLDKELAVIMANAKLPKAGGVTDDEAQS